MEDNYLLETDAVICNLSGDPSLFPSDCAYSARGTYWWRLEYMFDRFRKDLQELRPLPKWVRHVKKMIDESWLATDNDLHIQATKDVPDGCVKQYVSDTKGALMFFCQQSRNGRQECQVKHCVAKLKGICSRVCSVIDPDGMQMQHVDLRVTQQGSVYGLDIFLANCNRNCATSISELWASMHLQGHLSQPLHGWGQNGLWLQDLVLFTVFAKKCKSNHSTNELIPELEKAWLTTVSDLLDQYISCQYMVHNDIGRMLPARKFGGAETRKYTQVDLGTVWTLVGLCATAGRSMCAEVAMQSELENTAFAANV